MNLRSGVREAELCKQPGLHIELTVVYPDGNCKCERDTLETSARLGITLAVLGRLYVDVHAFQGSHTHFQSMLELA
jgi:hypothetical protein